HRAATGPAVRHPHRAGRLARRQRHRAPALAPPGCTTRNDMTILNGFTTDSTHALPLHVLDRDGFAAWNARQPAGVQEWLQHQQFTAAAGTAVLLPGDDGVAGAVLGVGDRADAYAYAHAPFALPAGSRWQLASELADADVANLQLGWGL